MTKSIYAILDEKAKSIGPLFVCENNEVAMRLVAQSYTDPNCLPCRYPSDFALLCLGDIDTSTGEITRCVLPDLVNKLDVILKV